jgi:hypothetical protein
MSRSRDPVELRQNQMRLSIDLSMGLCACNYMICLMRFNEDRNCENGVWRTCTARSGNLLAPNGEKKAANI